MNIKLYTGSILSLIIGYFFCIRSKEKFGMTRTYHTDKRIQRKPTILLIPDVKMHDFSHYQSLKHLSKISHDKKTLVFISLI